MRMWSEEEKEYLKDITPGHHHSEIHRLMCNKFNRGYTMSQIKGAIKRYKLNTGFTGHFKKGFVPYNKGMKGTCAPGSKKTWFKKGNIPTHKRPVGSERINVDGYIEIKVAECNKWRGKHNVVWEKHNGPIPKGHVVIFGDGNKLNLNPDNLILVTRHQLLTMNRNKLIQDDIELTKTGIVIADIYNKIGQVKKKLK